MKNFILNFLFIGLMAMYSCDNVYNYSPTPTLAVQNLDELLQVAALAPLPDTFAVDHSEPTRVVTNKKAELILASCVLVLPDGTPACVAAGSGGPCNIQIELMEVYTKKDMILNDLVTLSDGQILETGGMVMVKATFNDSIPLQVAEGETFKVRIPKTNTLTDSTQMKFYAEELTDEENEPINWKEKGEFYATDEGVYTIEHNAFNQWMACAYPYEIENDSLSQLGFEFAMNITSTEPALNNTSSRTYLVLNNAHSVLNGVFEQEGLFIVPNLSANESVTGVGFHAENETIFFGTAEGTTLQQNEMLLPLKPSAANEISSSLELLK